MTEPEQDPAKKPLHVSEAFRRARRNVLFWAVAVVAVSVGVKGEGPIRLGGAINGFEFSQTAVVVGALATLVVMAVGYLRAARDLRYLYTDREIKLRDEGIAAANAAISSHVEEMRTGVSEAQAMLAEIARTVQTSRESIEHAGIDDSGERTIELAAQTFQKIQDMAANPGGQSVRGELASEQGKLQSLLEEYKARMETSVATQIALPGVLGSQMASLSNRVEQLTTKFLEYRKELSDFSTSLDKTDRWWHRLDDHALVIITCLLALTLACWRLTYGPTLDAMLARFDDPQANICSPTEALELTPVPTTT